MPPAIDKTVRDLIYWHYAKIIAKSAGMGKQDYGFAMNKFKHLKHGCISRNEVREFIKGSGHQIQTVESHKQN